MCSTQSTAKRQASLVLLERLWRAMSKANEPPQTRLVVAKTRKGKRALEKRAPKLVRVQGCRVPGHSRRR